MCTPHVILTTTENLYFKERNGGSERLIDLPNVTLLVNLKPVSVCPKIPTSKHLANTTCSVFRMKIELFTCWARGLFTHVRKGVLIPPCSTHCLPQPDNSPEAHFLPRGVCLLSVLTVTILGHVTATCCFQQSFYFHSCLPQTCAPHPVLTATFAKSYLLKNIADIQKLYRIL